tara:strand:- start:3845 stop:4324 length:480 start_codon:yes stop_codon:yes gene_type:complete
VIALTNNTHIIYKHLTHADLWSHIAEDGISEYDFIPPTGSNIKWLLFSSVTESNILDGVVRIDINNMTSFTFHPYMHKSARIHKEQMIKELYELMFNNTSFKKCFVEFPSFMDHLKLFSVRMGMKYEATLKDCFMKDGELHSNDMYGIKKEQALKIGEA